MKNIFITLLLSLAFLGSPLFAEESSFNKQYTKSLFVSVESIPQKVYIGQVFPIKLKAIVAQKNFDAINNTFSGGANTEVLNPQSAWEKVEDNTYINTFYLKAKTKNATLPRLSLSLLQNKDALESEIINLTMPNLVQLKADPLFCNVIAQNLSINKYKTTSFDAKNAIIVLEIEAIMANLKDFALAGLAKSGIDSYSENNDTQKIFFYAIIPNYQKNFEFTYFDLRANKFNKISLPVTIESDEVSTQLGLNPKESIFEFYKTISYGVLAFIFFLLLIRKRKWYYLILMLIFLTLFLWIKIPLIKFN